ncbi:MAG TPA: magnesium and cobalt transport protein CorA [Mycobacteriales bacterium]|nr:magnesium and cobalt transport protein CorA [Mycobacteriales bacterium]
MTSGHRAGTLTRVTGIARRGTRPRRTRTRDRAVDEPQRTSPLVVDCGVYEGGRRLAGRLDPAAALQQARAKPGRFVWLGLFEPTDAELTEIAAIYGLHPLAVEDAVNAHQRPKVDEYDDMVFAVLKSIRYVEHDKITDKTEVVETGEVEVFLGADFVVTVRHGAACPLDGVRNRLEHDRDLLALGPAAVLYAVADHVVDDYEVVVDEVHGDLDEVEARVFGSRRGEDSQNVYQLKRELLEFKRAVVPLIRPIAQMVSGEFELIPEQIEDYLRDVEDHLLRVVEQLGGADELLSSILNANLTQLALQQNDDMRKMTAWAGIIAVPTAITGFYGQNIPYPGFGAHHGFYVSTGLIVGGMGYLYWLFKKKKWL